MKYDICPKCGKKGLRDVGYVYNTITRCILHLRMGDQECKHCQHRVKLVIEKKEQ